MDFARIYLVVLCGAISFGVSGLQFSILVLYLAANGFLLGVGSGAKAELEKRAAAIASANLMLVFLGGRTNPLANFLQIPLASYYFGHSWIAIVATCEALLHSGLALSRHQKFDSLTNGLFAIVFSALWFRRLFGRFFGLFHLLCSMAALGGLVWHICLQHSAAARIPVFVSCGLLGSTHLYRLVRMFICGHAEGFLERPWDDGNVMRLQVNTNKPVTVFPGCYFYVFFPGPLPFYDFFHGYAMMPVWGKPDQYVTGKTSDLTFLMSRTRGHHCRSLGIVSPGQRLRLDGPYGKDLQLHTFETVVLTAKGLGISGILPFALHLAARKRHDNRVRDKSARLRDSSEPVFGDLSRNVDLIWWLEHDDQDKWVGDQLRSLQEVDAKVCCSFPVFSSMLTPRKFLVVWCVYPVKRKPERKLPFEKNDYWKRRYSFGFEEFSRELRQEARYPGRTVVVASGEQKFVNTMRGIVVQNTTSHRIIEFANLEYFTPPGGFKSTFRRSLDLQETLVNSGESSLDKSQATPVNPDGIEMMEMDIAEQRTQKIREMV
ncbi:hypothetical protein B0T10DRAFT_533794 [Thelonectria olida]|uniref:FAD-binding FR-type domain-containing protein n=1 Tax=Thelonectria olida TaxID=1576542 RepID=A0A9P8VQI2_9HYPO|nr:hypothetical protein B0T10DRAFT_533794 [Thelonectria olida]